METFEPMVRRVLRKDCPDAAAVAGGAGAEGGCFNEDT